MKTLTFACLCLLLLSACTGKGTGSVNTNSPNGRLSHDTAQIRMVLDSQLAAWNRGSVREFMKGYWHSDSLRFIGKRGIRYGYDSVQASYLRHYPDREQMGHLRFDKLDIQALDKEKTIFNATGRWKISGKDSAAGFFSLLFRKTAGEWKIITDHTW